MVVRLARPEEGEALRALHVRTWEATYRGLVPEEMVQKRLVQHRAVDWADRVREQEAAGGGVLVLVSGDELVGLCQYGPTDDPDHDPTCVGQVYRLYVDPRFQGRGGGRRLIETAGDLLCDAGMRTATLYVLKTDPRARGFYQHLGWQPDGAWRDPPPITDVRYVKQLI
jgi:GNAT superfamily N-acetyltransferase